MKEPQPGIVQYRGLTIHDLLTHMEYSRTRRNSAHLFKLRLCPTGIEIPLKLQEYKIKPVELQLVLGSSAFGREALGKIREILQTENFDSKIRRSPKLQLITTVVAAIPVDDPEFEYRFTELLKIVTRESGFSWPTAIAAEHMTRSVGSSVLPGAIVHNTEMQEFGRKLGRALGTAIRYLVLAILLAGVIYLYYSH